jgi:hypothetical protein
MPYKMTPIAYIDLLYKRGILILNRDIKKINDMSLAEKLPDAAAKHLVAYMKLLAEMKEAHKEIEASKKLFIQASATKASDEELLRAVMIETKA